MDLDCGCIVRLQYYLWWIGLLLCQGHQVCHRLLEFITYGLYLFRHGGFGLYQFTGAVIYMFAHALATSMLFAMAGWVYDQTHSRDIPSLGGLMQKCPLSLGRSLWHVWHP